MQHVAVGETVSCVMFTLRKICVCACKQAIKSALPSCSDILGSVTAMWLLQGLTVCMLYISHSNLHKHKAWLAINNPSMISWTRYLVRLQHEIPVNVV